MNDTLLNNSEIEEALSSGIITTNTEDAEEVIDAASIKQYYIDNLQDEDRKIEVASLDRYEPILKPIVFHFDDEANNKDMNQMLYETGLDLMSLDNEFINTANNIDNLITMVNSRLEIINNNIQAEYDRLSSMNFICSSYKFDQVISLTGDNFSGDFEYDTNNVFSAYSDISQQVTLSIGNIDGNGYKGNQYVYDTSSNEYKNKTIDTSDESAISDNNILTIFEYSRLNSSNTGESINGITNYDSEPVRCSISLYNNDSLFNTLTIASDLDATITDISLSNDSGLTYYSLGISPINLGTNSNKYMDSEGYKNGFINFPYTNTVRLTIESNKSRSSETISKLVNNDYVMLNNTIRKVITINDIQAYYNSYSDSTMRSKTYEFDDGQAIGIYADESNISQNNNITVTYTLTVNGIDYEVVPFNSNRSGVKIIKHSIYEYDSESEVVIQEQITTCYLTVKYSILSEGISPLIANLKLCVRY